MRHDNITEDRAAAATQNIKERDYWLNKLSGELVKSFFPTDFQIKSTKEHPCFDAVVFQLEGELFSQLMKLSNGKDYLLHMILVTAVIILLEKYSGNRDIIVGVPIYKQDIEGKFINNILALRLPVEKDKRFKELLLEVKETLVEATENQNYPLETLLHRLNIELSEDEFPLFDTAVLLVGLHDKSYLEDIAINIIFSFDQKEAHLEGVVEYNSLKYQKTTIQRIAPHFTNLMGIVLFNLEEKVGAVDIFSKEEKKQLLVDFNHTEVPYPGEMTIPWLFAEQARETPGNTACIEGKQMQLMSYQKLHEKTDQLAGFLQTKGVNAGHIVGLMVERSLEMIVGMLGILKAGGAYLPIDADYPGERIAYMLDDSNVRLLLTHRHVLGGVKFHIDKHIETIDLTDESIYLTGERKPINSAKPFELAYVIYTSGSTGKSKGVTVEHHSVCNTLCWRKDYYHFTRDDVILQVLGYTFDSSVEDIFTTLVSGAKLVIIPQGSVYDLQYLKKLITRTGVTYFLIVPAFYKSFLQEIGESLTGLRAITVAGDNITEKLVKTHYGKLKNVKLYNEYGPTENSVCSTVYEFEPDNPEVLIGKPISNVKCFILHAGAELCPIGVPGELCLSGRGLAREYLKRPGLTGEKFVPHPFLPGQRMYRTGDLAKWQPDGNIRFLGRIDHQVKIRGFRVELGEIETRLLEIKEITGAVVVASGVRVSENSGTIADGEEKFLCAYIVSDKEHDISELKEILAKSLPDYMIPAYFVQLDEIPLTPNGKIDRKALPEPETRGSETNYIAPRDEKEKEMTEIWSDVLDVEIDRLSIDASFFDLGGHSLKATVLVSRINKKFNVNIPMVNVFETPTIRELAEFVKEAAGKTTGSINPVEEKEYYPLSSTQHRLYILQYFKLNSTAYNVSTVVELEEEPEWGKLEKTFRELINRHECLRTSFAMAEENPVQKIHNPLDLEFQIDYYECESGEKDLHESVEEKIRKFIRPFDLSNAPLVRVGLVKKGSAGYILMVDMHHILTDGVSYEILIDDFASLYRGHQLPKLKLRYKDYSAWQENPEVKKVLEEQAEYWLKQFEGEIPLLNLPLDYSRPALQSFEGDIVNFSLNLEESKAVNRIVESEGATLFMVILAVYNVFLSKICSQEDILLGTPIITRNHADWERVIGLFLNTLVLRHYPSGQKTFTSFLRELKKRTLKAFENQDYQFEDLVERAAVNRDMSRNPFFDVQFVSEDLSVSSTAAPGKETESLKIKSYPYKSKTSKLDLSLFAGENRGSLNFAFEYCTKLFRQETIVRFVRYFKNIVSSIIRDPEKKISAIEILSQEEKNRVLYEFNDTAAGYPGDKLVHRLFEEQVERSPDAIAVIAPMSTGNGVLTYRELNRRAHQLELLLQENGSTPAAIVGIMVEPTVEMIIGILGVLKTGGAYLPIAPGSPRERLKYMLTDSGAGIMISTRALMKKNKPHHSRIIFLDDLPAKPAARAPNPVRPAVPGSLVYVIYTSGTTGKPKGVLLEHENLVNYVNWFRGTVGLTSKDKTVLTSSFVFDLGYTSLYTSILSGGELHLLRKEIYLSTGELLDYIRRQKITYIKVTPSLFSVIVHSPGFSREFCKNLRLAVIGGEAINVKDIERARRVCGHLQIMNHYGPTEATIGCVATLVDFDKFEEYKTHPAIGTPINNTAVYILGRNRELVAIGAPGELCISGACLARGYLNRPELTTEKFINIEVKVEVEAEVESREQIPNKYMSYMSYIYKTGDLARWLPDGRIEFLGRLDHQVKVRGYRIELGEIENRLIRMDTIKEAVVVNIKKEEGENDLYAYFVTEEEIDITELKDKLSKTLPGYMLPTYWMQLDDIPLTANGKVNKKALPIPGIRTGEGYVAPGNAIEEKLAGIWSQVLGIEKNRIGIDASFFDSGGHSLKATVLVLKIHKEFDIRMPLTEVFKTPTIRGMSHYIGEATKDKFISLEPVEKKEYYPVSSAQKRLYLLQQRYPGSAIYNRSSIFLVQGKIDKEILEGAAGKLIHRHESLRTSFDMVNEETVQRVHDNTGLEIEYYHPGKDVDKKSINKDFDSKGFVKLPLEIEMIIKNFIRPFDLSQAPLLRIGIIETGDKNHILMVDIHHIISDGLSDLVLSGDFMALSGGEHLPELRLQYKDFSKWQRTFSRSGEMKKQEEYWQNEFRGDIPKLTIPTDYARPGLQSFEGDIIEFEINPGQTALLKQLAGEEQVTLFMLCLAIYNVLLSKLSGQEDIVVGTGVAGREHTDIEKIIGMFVNTLALRNYPYGEKTFKEFLREVRKRALQAFENQSYLFEDLVEKVKTRRDPSRNPLFDTVLAMQNMERDAVDNEKLKQNDLKLIPYKYNTERSLFDIAVICREKAETLAVLVTYNTRIYKKETIDIYFNNFKDILEAVIKNKELKLKDLRLTSDLEMINSTKLQDDAGDFDF